MKLLTGVCAILSAWLFLVIAVDFYCKTYVKPTIAIKMGDPNK